MNSLNSVLVEKIFSKNNEKVEEVSLFKIETFGKQAELVMKVLKKGRGIRVVGRLKQVGESAVIIGETVEFKSQFDTRDNHG